MGFATCPGGMMGKVPVTLIYAMVVPILLGVGLLGWIANMLQVTNQNDQTKHNN